jgi:ABC-type branched-subunit amino acid transport system substrate-binding protein
VKIGLVAPFEGAQRDVGSDVIPAVRLAIREYADQVAASGQRGRVAVELVAYDDLGDPEQAIAQAEKLIADPDVKVVIGHWTESATLAAAPIYAEAGIPLVAFSTVDLPANGYNFAPSKTELTAAAQSWADTTGQPTQILVDMPLDTYLAGASQQADTEDLLISGPDWGSSHAYALHADALEGTAFVSGAASSQAISTLDYPTDIDSFIADYEQGSLGAPPGLLAWTAYEATWLAIEIATGATNASPWASSPSFDENGRRTEAPIFLYQWQNGERQLIERLQ